MSSYALVKGRIRQSRLDLDDLSFGSLQLRDEAHVVGQIETILEADIHDVVALLAIGRARLDGAPERFVAVGFVLRSEEHEIAGARRPAHHCRDVIGIVGVGPGRDVTAELVGEVARHQVEHAAGGAGSVVQRFAALEDLDALDHVAGQGVRIRARVEAVVEPDAVHKPENIARAVARQARALHRNVVVGKRPCRREVEAGYFHLEHLLRVDVELLLDVVAAEAHQVRAVCGEPLRQRGLEALAVDVDLLDAVVALLLISVGVLARAGGRIHACITRQQAPRRWVRRAVQWFDFLLVSLSYRPKTPCMAPEKGTRW